MASLLYRRNPLAYPAGSWPGIDPTHPASKNCYFSAVPCGGPNYVNLVTGAPLTNQQGSLTTVLTPSIDARLGPALSAPTGAKSLGIATSVTASFITHAAIFRANFNASFDTLIAVNGGVAGSLWLNNGLVYFFSNWLALTAGSTYFVGASVYAEPSGLINNVSIVVKNLETGATSSEFLQRGFVAPLAITSIAIANDGFNEFSPFPIAAGMSAATFLTVQQLQQWAQDPWAFWYPRQAERLIAASSNTYAAFSIPQIDGRTVTQMIGY